MNDIFKSRYGVEHSQYRYHSEYAQQISVELHQNETRAKEYWDIETSLDQKMIPLKRKCILSWTSEWLSTLKFLNLTQAN